jgi:hypothetical protein
MPYVTLHNASANYFKHTVIPTVIIGSPNPIATPNAILSEVLKPPFVLAGTGIGAAAIVNVEIESSSTSKMNNVLDYNFLYPTRY